MCYFWSFPRESMNFQKSGFNSCFCYTLTNVGYWDSRWLVYSKKNFSFPRYLKYPSPRMKSKNHGKLGSSKIIYTAFFNMWHICHVFSILNTWQTLLINHSFLRQLQTPSQDSTTIAIYHKQFKRTKPSRAHWTPLFHR